MAKRLTQEQLGARLGISQSLVARLAKRGMPTDSVGAARRWRAKNLDPTRGGRQAAGGDESLDALRRRKLVAEARLLEQRAALGPRGTLDAHAVEQGLFLAFVLTRAGVDTLHTAVLDLTDDFCPPGAPGYAKLYSGLCARLRNAHIDRVWMPLVEAFAKHVPELLPWFRSFAERERGGRAASADKSSSPPESAHGDA